MIDNNRIKASQIAKGEPLVTTVIKKKEKGFIVPKFVNAADLIGKRNVESEMRKHERSPYTARKNIKPNWFYSTPFGVPRGINPLNLRVLASIWIVQGCISVYQSDLRAMKYKIVARDPKRAKEALVVETGKYVENRLSEVNNDGESVQDLWEKWIKDILEIDAGVFVAHFAEDAYIPIEGDNNQLLQEYVSDEYPDGKVLEFTCEDGARFYKDFYEDGALMGYWHHLYHEGTPAFFSKRQISYAMFNPSSYSPYGWSKVQQLYDVLIAMISSVMNTSDYMSRGAVPAGIIELRGADEDEAASFRDYWRKRVQGNPHKFAIIGSPEDGQLKFIPLNFSIEDITFLNGLEFFWKVVLATFHISPNEMGLVADVNKSNSESQERVTRRNQKMPMFTKIERLMEVFFIPGLTANHELVKFQWETPEDVDKLVKEEGITNAQVTTGRRTMNEIRVIDGEEPYADPRADIPMPFWETGTEDPLGIDVAGELGSIADIINGRTGEQTAQIAAEIQNLRVELEDLSKKGAEDFTQAHSDNIDAFVKTETTALNTALVGALKSWFGKVKEMVTDYVSRNPDADVNTALLETMNRITEPGSTVAVEIRSQLYENIVSVFSRAFNTENDLETPYAITQTIPLKALEFLKTHALLVADKLTDDLSSTVKQQIIQGMSKGEPIREIAKRIQGVLDTSKVRAKTIARTETIRALAHAQHDRITVDGFVEWEFFAHIDDRTDSVCKELDGKIFSIDDKEFLPPIHPNCRCTILTVIPDEEEDE